MSLLIVLPVVFGALRQEPLDLDLLGGTSFAEVTAEEGLPPKAALLPSLIAAASGFSAPPSVPGRMGRAVAHEAPAAPVAHVDTISALQSLEDQVAALEAVTGETCTLAPLEPDTTALLRASSRVPPPVMMAKKVEKIIKLAIDAGKANPAPPIGPALGAAGVNIMMFCKEYNARTQDQAGMVVPVEISVYEDRSFTFILKTPPAAVLLKKAAKISKASGTPGGRDYKKAGEVTKAQIEEIAKIKMPDLNTNKIESAMNTVMGTAKNMGIVVTE